MGDQGHAETLEGRGEEGNFLGLSGELAAYEHSRVCIIPVPLDASTSFGHGTDSGPAALIEASRSIEGYDVETESEVYTLGIHTMDPVQESTPAKSLERLEQVTLRALQDGKFPVAVGGEHTLSAAPIRAAGQVYPKFSVLQFDAHTDLRPAYEGNPLSHASVMARAKECPSVKNIVAVGIRAMDKSELSEVKRKDLFFDHELQDGDRWIDKVIERLEKRVYVTFDVDVFSAATMPSTGTPEPGGMSWFQCMALLKRVCEEREVIGFDIVELMPLEGLTAPNFIAAKVVYKFLNYRLQHECKAK